MYMKYKKLLYTNYNDTDIEEANKEINNLKFNKHMLNIRTRFFKKY